MRAFATLVCALSLARPGRAVSRSEAHDALRECPYGAAGFILTLAESADADDVGARLRAAWGTSNETLPFPESRVVGRHLFRVPHLSFSRETPLRSDDADAMALAVATVGDAVVDVEADCVLRAASHAPLTGSTGWGLRRIVRQDDHVPYAPSVNGSNVVAYVFDTGIMPDHPEFGGRVLPGWSAGVPAVDRFGMQPDVCASRFHERALHRLTRHALRRDHRRAQRGGGARGVARVDTGAAMCGFPIESAGTRR